MSMIKIVDPRGWEWDRPIVQRVKISSRGLRGADRAEFLKTASHEFVDLIDKTKLAKDEEPVHLIALGASECWGSNRNGDGFKEAACKKYHGTFVKYARWYRNHANKNPKKSYGYIKASAYNNPMRRVELLAMLNRTKEAAERNGGLVADQEMEKISRGEDIPVSMACRVPHDVCFEGITLIETRRGLVPISEVKVGDEVKTHLGRWRSVLKVFCRPFSGTMIRLDVCGVNDCLSSTHSHPLWLIRQEVLRKCHGSVGGTRRRHTVRGGKDCVTCGVTVAVAPEWVAAENVHVGDYLVYPVHTPGGEKVDPDWAYMSGAFAGDGSKVQQRRGRKRDGEHVLQGISMTIDKATPQVVARIKCSAKAIHGRQQPAHESGNGKNSVQIAVYHQGLARFCVRNIGTGSRQKKVHEDIFEWDKKARLCFLAGHLDTDGSVDRGVRFGSGRHLSTSRALAESIQKLWWGLGVPASLHTETPTSFNGEKVTIYVVGVPSYGVARLDGLSAKAEGIRPPSRQHSQCFLHDNRMLLRVQRSVHEYNELDVFNLSVAEDETYIAASAIAHNCSGCGNQARTRDDYCTGSTCKYGGCKDNLTKVAQDGHILHVDNPTPTWFDMSKVYRPADRIAYGGNCSDYWDKAASAEDFMPGAELAQALGVTAPLNVILGQDQPHHWSMAVEGQIKLAYGLAELEQRGHGQNRERMRAFTASVQPELTHDMISILGIPGTEKSAEALGALAEKKILLPLRDFARWMGKSAMADQAEALLPRIFGHLVEQGRLENQLTHNRFAISEKTASLVQRTLAGNLVANFGLSHDAVSTRAMRSSSRMTPTPNPKSTFWNEKTAADCPEAATLAEEYALYKLAALHKIAATDQDFPLTGRLALAQNCV